MAFEKIEGLRINSAKLKEQCALISQNYDYQNTSYVLLAKRVSQLCEQDDLRSNAINGFKFQMSNYKSVFDALCYANELDKNDISKLELILDTELSNGILDGTEILEKIKQANFDYESYSRQSDFWYSAYMNAEWFEVIYSDFCYYTYLVYKSRAEDAYEDKKYWESRAELLLSLSAKLSGLFVKGAEVRDCANSGINQIATAFDVNTNTYREQNTAWKEKLLTCINDSLYIENGKIDWKLIEQILSKDADAISDAEYMLVSYAYMNMDVIDLNKFFMLCASPKVQDRNEMANLYLDGKLDSLSMNTNGMVTLDTAKIEAICKQANVYQTTLLALIKYGDLDEVTKNELRDSRDIILRRITTAQTLDEIHSFWGTKDGNDYFNFELSDEGLQTNKSLKISYNSIVYNNNGALAMLEPHTVTITDTLRDTGIITYAPVALREATLRELTSHSGIILGESVAGETLSMVTENIPRSGLLLFGLEIVVDVYENEKNKVFINELSEVLRYISVSRLFDCCGNFVLYDDNTASISIYEDIYTEQRVEKIKDLLDKNNFDKEYLFEHTGNVFKECYDYMKEHGDNSFDEIMHSDN